MYIPVETLMKWAPAISAFIALLAWTFKMWSDYKNLRKSDERNRQNIKLTLESVRTMVEVRLNKYNAEEERTELLAILKKINQHEEHLAAGLDIIEK